MNHWQPLAILAIMAHGHGPLWCCSQGGIRGIRGIITVPMTLINHGISWYSQLFIRTCNPKLPLIVQSTVLRTGDWFSTILWCLVVTKGWGLLPWLSSCQPCSRTFSSRWSWSLQATRQPGGSKLAFVAMGVPNGDPWMAHDRIWLNRWTWKSAQNLSVALWFFGASPHCFELNVAQNLKTAEFEISTSQPRLAPAFHDPIEDPNPTAIRLILQVRLQAFQRQGQP